jgi:sodium-dependent phosphate cotransporter
MSIIALLFAIYLFLLAIKTMGISFKLMGSGFAEELIATTANPVAGLFVGILATSIIQSSSSTISILVALVGSGVMPVFMAIPIVMGANIGTTITNAIVSLAHINRGPEFRRAFSGAIVHDLFNVMAVLVLFPLELQFQLIENTAVFLADQFAGAGGLLLISPLKYVIDPVVHSVEWFVIESLGMPAPVLLVIALAMLFFSLKVIVSTARSLTSSGAERLLDRFLFRNAATAFSLGVAFTAVVQSSSVTTSLVVPIVGAGLLTVEQIFPYVLGANIGTTVTAILAALGLAGSVEVEMAKAAITVAFAHLIFNVVGTLLFYPVRDIPIKTAKWIADTSMKSKKRAIIYILVSFYVIPILFIIMMR